MNSPKEFESQKLLREIEARDGRLRLHLNAFVAEHNDPAWDVAVMGQRPQIPDDRKPLVSMFNGDNLRRLCGAAAVLAPKHKTKILETMVGWTSVPVCNACAVKRANTVAVALNIRLNNILIPANVLLVKMLEADDTSAMRHNIRRIKILLSAASKDRIDTVLSEIRPFADPTEFKWGLRLTQPQVLFVLLHEYGHLILGHHDQEQLWSGHPLSSIHALYFNGSQKAELEADRFALDHILDRALWPEMARAFPEGGFDFFDDEANAKWLIPSQLLYMFSCFHMLRPTDPHFYYQVPRTHPHPFDRMEQVLQFLGASPYYDHARAKKFTGILQGTFS